MLWEVTRHGEGAETLDRTRVVEADNWYLALREYLNYGDTGEKRLASVSSTVRSDGSVTALDPVTRQRFSLAPLADAKATESVEPADTAPEDSPVKPTEVSCELIFEREVPPAQEPGIRYIEHHYAAMEPGLSRETFQSLALAKFFDLRKRDVSPKEKLFINVQLFDRAADESNRSPELSLLWKEWEDDEPKIRFLEDGDDTQGSLLSSGRMDAKPDTDPDQGPTTSAENPATDDAKSKIDELVITAFERVQDLFAIRDHRSAATFVLSLARELSSCEGGFCLLERSGKAPAEVHKEDNPDAPAPVKHELTLTGGIVGFATRNGAAVHVVDPENDPRCIDDLDLAGSTPPRNLLCVPLQHEGHTIGALLFWNAPGDAGFSKGSINALSYIAGALAEHIAVSLPARDGEYFADERPPQRRSRPPKRISLIPLPFLNKSKS